MDGFGPHSRSALVFGIFASIIFFSGFLLGINFNKGGFSDLRKKAWNGYGLWNEHNMLVSPTADTTTTTTTMTTTMTTSTTTTTTTTSTTSTTTTTTTSTTSTTTTTTTSTTSSTATTTTVTYTTVYSRCWRVFDVLPLDVRCLCDANPTGSCGRCLTAGRKEWALALTEGQLGGHMDISRIYEVSNLIYEHGTPWFIENAQGANFIEKCGDQCNPTFWDYGGQPGWWQIYDGHPINKDYTVRNGKHPLSFPNFSCPQEAWTAEPVVVVSIKNWQWTYHYYAEDMLAAFMTAGHVALHHGCAFANISIYLAKGDGFDGHYRPVWDSIFGTRVSIKDGLHGCYKHVYYGSLNLNLVPVNYDGLPYDPVLATWQTAFSFSLQRAWTISVQSASAPYGPNDMLYIPHRRAPDWMQSINWTTSRARVLSLDLGAISIAEQIRALLNVKGMIGVAGSGITNLIFLKAPAPVLAIVTVWRDTKTWCPVWGQWGQDEATTLCYAQVGIHVGHTYVHWRYCKADMGKASAAFSQQTAEAVLKLLYSENDKSKISQSGRQCLIIDEDETSLGWPRCDQLVVQPMEHPTRSCSGFHSVGETYYGSEVAFKPWQLTPYRPPGSVHPQNLSERFVVGYHWDHYKEFW